MRNTFASKRAFTLVEFIITMVITAFLLVMILGQNLSVFRKQMFYVSRSNLAQDTLLISDFFVKKVQGIGGGSVRPWMATWVENNCGVRGPFAACDGSDRLTLATAQNPLTECFIEAQVAPNIVQVATPGTCCLTNQFLNQSLMLVEANSYAQIYGIAVDTVNCQLTYAPGQASPNDSVPVNPDWGGGTVTVVDVTTYYLDSVAHQVKQFSDLNNNGAMDVSLSLVSQEVSILVDRAFDFQATLGFDLVGDNNLVYDGSTTDSWLYNAPGEVFGAGVFTGVEANQMRMIGIGVVVGTAANFEVVQTPGIAKILDGPNRSVQGWDFKAIVSRATPRNNFIFQ